MQTISRQNLKQKIDSNEDFTLIEVLPTDSFRDFHLPGAMNVPLSDEAFDENIQKAADKDNTVVVYCMNKECDASPKAARRMEELGFKHVLDYEDGKEDWKESGLPVEH